MMIKPGVFWFLRRGKAVGGGGGGGGRLRIPAGRLKTGLQGLKSTSSRACQWTDTAAHVTVHRRSKVFQSCCWNVLKSISNLKP